MDAPTPPTERSYWCFISYRHADNKESGRQWASWLHQAIETYEVPEDLVGTVNSRGDTIPERIFPVFRDEEELPADADLARPIELALKNSKTVVVLCSPRAVQSQYVAQEIHEFKKLGRSDRIMAALIDGEPNASRDPSKDSQECFPKPLMHPIDEQGNLLTDQWAEPIAADFRLADASEGWTSPTAYRQALDAEGSHSRQQIDHLVESYSKSFNLAKLKVIAGIIGVPLGTLTQRDKAYQLAKEKRKARVFRAVAGVMALLAVAAIIAGVFAYQKKLEAIRQRAEAERQKTEAIAARDDAEGLIRFLTQDLAEALSGYFPIAKRREVSKRVAEYLAGQQDDKEIANTEQNWSFTLRLAQIFEGEKRIEEARQKFKQSFEMATALKGQADLDAPWQSMAGESAAEWAMLELNDNRTERVGELGQTTLDLYEELLATDPHEVKWLQGKANGLTLISDAAVARGDFATAREYCVQQYKIRLKLYQDDPKNQLKTKRLAVAHERMGGLNVAEGKFNAGVTSYRESVKYAKLASNREPGNMTWRNDVCLTLFHLSNALSADQQFQQALENYQESMALLNQLCDWDPENVIWQQILFNVTINAAIIYSKPELKDSDEALELVRKAKVLLDGLIEKSGVTSDTAASIILFHNMSFDIYQSFDLTTEILEDIKQAFNLVISQLPEKQHTEYSYNSLAWLAIRIEIGLQYQDKPDDQERRAWLDKARALAQKAKAISPENPQSEVIEDFAQKQLKNIAP